MNGKNQAAKKGDFLGDSSADEKIKNKADPQMSKKIKKTESNWIAAGNLVNNGVEKAS